MTHEEKIDAWLRSPGNAELVAERITDSWRDGRDGISNAVFAGVCSIVSGDNRGILTTEIERQAREIAAAEVAKVSES